MKKLRFFISMVTAIMLACFAFIGFYFVINEINSGGRYLNSSYNNRITHARTTIVSGTIYDRSGVTLAYSQAPNTRAYNDKESIRLAVSQTVGDQMSKNATGVELFHADKLLGLTGTRITTMRQLVTGSAKKGDNLTLTISATLSEYVSKLIKKTGLKGACAIINYKTGEILCMVSLPDYDPQVLTSSTYAEDSAYLNKCVQGRYAPGSTFKTVVLLSALENIPGIMDESFTCTGTIEYEGGTMSCAGNTVHGTLSLKDAYAKSCNITFSSLAARLGSDKLKATAEKLSFNDEFLFDDIILYESQVPSDINTMLEIMQTGIGQGRVLTTPLHMAMISGAMANGGTMMTPKLIKNISTDLNTVYSYLHEDVYKTVCTPDNALTVVKLMRQTVKSGTGTRANVSLNEGFVCGKTGSAETSEDKTKETNAWFTGFIYDDDYHPYAISIILEGGGAGGKYPAEIAGKALKFAAEQMN